MEPDSGSGTRVIEIGTLGLALTFKGKKSKSYKEPGETRAAVIELHSIWDI